MASMLLFNFRAPEKLSLLRALAFRLNLRCIEVPADRQGGTLRDLLAGRFSPAPESFGEEMLILSGLADADLDLLLRQLRENGLSVPLKAVTTESNLDWTALRLRTELLAEAWMMRAAAEKRVSR